jgi:hypothetical protein
MIRQATLDDIGQIKAVADRYKRELGFVLRPALAAAVGRNELLFHPGSGAFCHYHRRRDGVSVIYEICVPEEFQGQGIGLATIWKVTLPIQLKCPVDNASNGFYARLGFTLLGTEQGKKRPLNLWRLETYPSKVFPSVDGANQLYRSVTGCAMWYVWHPEQNGRWWHVSPATPVVSDGWRVEYASPRRSENE